MIRTVSTPVRDALVRLRQDLSDAREMVGKDRPVSRNWLKETIDDLLRGLGRIEAAVLDDALGTVDEDGECWHLDDLVVLGPAVTGGVQ